VDFLPAGKRYSATLYRDGPTAEMGAKGKDIVVERRDVRRGDVITLRMAAGGGFAIRLAAR
jgi:alpha-glucosidase